MTLAGGTASLDGTNTYTGATAINAGATLALAGAGSIAASADVEDNGVFDIAATTAGASIQSLSGNGAVNLGAQTLTLTNASGDFAGSINGTGGLALNGGNAILSGTNTYTGGTTINGGVLQVGNGGTTGSIVGNVLDNGTLAFNRADDIDFAGTISGSGGLAKLGAGTLTLSGANTYTGTTSVLGGSLAMDIDNGLPVASKLSVDGGTFDLGGHSANLAQVQLLSGSIIDGNLVSGGNYDLQAGTVSANLGGSAGLDKTGAGTVVLSGANTYSGGTTVSGGILQGNATSLQGNIANNAQVSFDQANDGTYAGAMSGTGSVVKTGPGRLVLANANTYSGGTIINGGILQVGDGGASGSLVGNVLNNGTLAFNRADAASFAGTISGSGGVDKLGAGTLTLTGANTYSGTTSVLNGTLALGNDNALGNASKLAVNGGTVDLGNHSANLAQVQLLSGAIANGNLVSANNYDLRAGTVSANLGGSAGLDKTGAGTVVLSGTNTYSGGTTVAGGVLQGNAASLQGDIANNAQVSFDQANDGTYAGAMSGSGSVTKTGAGRLVLANANTYTGGTTINQGVLQVGDGGSLAGDVVDNAILVFNRADNSSFAGSITGNGGLVKLGGGTLNLDNTVNLKNTIQVDGGTLAVNQSVNTTGQLIVGAEAGSSGAVSLGNGASLSAASEIVGGLGNGAITQTGGTHTVAQTLNLGFNAGGSGAYSLSGGQLTVGSQIVVGGDGSVLNVSGGSLQASTIVNQKTFNYSGGTVTANLVNQGSVTLSGEGTRTIFGNVTNEGTINVHETAAVYTGDFINNGAYITDPSSSQFNNLSVGPNGYLQGGAGDTFTVTGNFNNASTQNTQWNTSQSNLVFTSPEPSQAAQHVMQLAGVDYGPRASGTVNNFAWGSVTLSNGDRLALADGNTTPGAALYTRRLNLPGGVSELNSISSDFNVYYDPTLPENAYLQGRTNFGSGGGRLLPWSFVPFTGELVVDPLLTPNEKSFAAALNEACGSPSAILLTRCVQLQGLAPAQQKVAIASLTPDQTPGQMVVPINFSTTRMDAPFTRLFNLRHGWTAPLSMNFNGVQLPTDKLAQALGMNPRGGAAGDGNEPFRDSRLGIFVQSRFNMGNLGGNPWTRSFEFNNQNVTLGADYRFTDQLVAGVAFNYTHNSTTYTRSAGQSETDTYMGALYGSYYLPEDFYVDWLANYGGNNYSLSRRYAYAGFIGQTSGNPGSNQFSFALNGGKEFHWQEWLISPFMRWEYINMHIDGYQEQGGGGFAMTVNGQNNESLVHDLGVQISHAISLPFGVLTPSLRFEWEHQYLNDNRSIGMRLTDAKPGLGSFVIQTGQPDRDYFNLGGSVSAALPNGGAAFVRYETRLGQSYISEHIVEAGVRLTF